MADENTKKNFKQHDSSLDTLKEKSRDLHNQIRKSNREQLLTRKRFPVDKKTAETAQQNAKFDESVDYNVEKVVETVKLLKRPSSNTCHQLKYLRQAFSYTPDFVDAFLQVDGSLYTLIGYLTGKDTTLQLEAAWCVTNMSANEHDNFLALVKATAPYLITYLQGGSELLVDQSAWALGNMAADDERCRVLLEKQGIVQPLLHLVNQCNYGNTLQSSLFALCNMARSSALIIPHLMASSLPDTIIKIFKNTAADLNVIGELAWLLTYMTMDEKNGHIFIEKGIVPCLVHWLCKVRPHQQEYLFAVTPMLRCLGNIVGIESLSEIDELLLLENGVLLETLNNFLFSNKRHLIKECLWVLANVFACDFTLDKDAVKRLIPNIARHLQSAYEIKKEAAMCMCNIVPRDKQLDNIIASKDTIQHFIDFLRVPSNELQMIALQFIELIVREKDVGEQLFSKLDGPSYLEALECNENEMVRNHAIFLLETYYEQEEEK